MLGMEVNIGLIGIGTIGSGVVRLLQENCSLIEKRTGIRINLKKACDKEIKKGIAIGLGRQQLCASYEEVLNDSSIDIVIELVGGYEPAKSIIEGALKNNKHVVTANKAVLSKYSTEIFQIAENFRRYLNFEASVAGCIPIIRILQESYNSDEFKAIYGILNGTTNYILTKMQEGLGYEEALKKAQMKGFAEADPSFDVEGKDTAQKLNILSLLAFNSEISEQIYTEGIASISKNDIMYADELGYVIKLLAIAKKKARDIELRVHPTMIPKSHELSSVSNEFNAIYLVGNNTGDTMFYGKGAGQMPTAVVIVSDIIDISRKLISKEYAPLQRNFNKFTITQMEKTVSRYYFRFHVVDKPGVLGKITSELGRNNVSIAGVSQKEENKDIVPLIITTHLALERDVRNAIECIDRLDVVRDKTTVIRIEDIP